MYNYTSMSPASRTSQVNGNDFRDCAPTCYASSASVALLDRCTSMLAVGQNHIDADARDARYSQSILRPMVSLYICKRNDTFVRSVLSLVVEIFVGAKELKDDITLVATSYDTIRRA